MNFLSNGDLDPSVQGKLRNKSHRLFPVMAARKTVTKEELHYFMNSSLESGHQNFSVRKEQASAINISRARKP